MVGFTDQSVKQPDDVSSVLARDTAGCLTDQSVNVSVSFNDLAGLECINLRVSHSFEHIN